MLENKLEVCGPVFRVCVRVCFKLSYLLNSNSSKNKESFVSVQFETGHHFHIFGASSRITDL